MKPRLRLILFPIISVLIELIIVKIGIIFMEPDDYLIAGIVGGTYGSGSNQIIMAPFISVILCSFLHVLNIVSGYFNSYTVFLLIMVALGFFNVHYLVVKKQWPWFWHLAVLILECMFMCFLTFTTVAYLLAGTGMLLLLCIDGNGKVTPSCVALGIISLSFGTMLRNEVVLTVGLLFVPVMISVLGRNKKAVIVTVVYGVLFFALLTVSNRIAYHSSETWSSYYEWDESSVKIRDYTRISYDEYEELFQKEGWTRNDLEMVYSWQFADKNIFSTGATERIVSGVKLRDRYEIRIGVLLLSLIRNKSVWLALAVTAVMLGFIRNRKDRWLTVLSLVILLGLIFALYVRVRYVSRVAIPITVLGILQLLFVNKDVLADADKKKKILLNTICLVLVSTFMMLSLYGRVGTIRQKTNNSALAEYVSKNPDKIFIMNSGVVNSLCDATPIKDISKDSYKYNVIKAGSWDSFSGRYYEQTNTLGFEHPESVFLELADNSDAYYVTFHESDAQRIKTFLEEHYGMNMELIETDTGIQNTFMYSFSKGE